MNGPLSGRKGFFTKSASQQKLAGSRVTFHDIVKVFLTIIVFRMLATVNSLKESAINFFNLVWTEIFLKLFLQDCNKIKLQLEFYYYTVVMSLSLLFGEPSQAFFRKGEPSRAFCFQYRAKPSFWFSKIELFLTSLSWFF